MSAALSPLQICPFSGGKFRFSPSPIPCFNSLPVQARLGLLFLLLPFFFPPVLSPAWIGLVSSHPGSPLSRIRPQLPHTPPTGSVWGFAGVASLLDLQKRTQGHTGASLVFLPKTSLPLPLRGRGRVPSILGLLGLPCSSTTGSRVSNRAGLGLYWCRFPTLSPDRP